MASDITEPPPVAPQKVSRYRSVRRAQEQAQQSQHSAPPMPPMPPMPAMLESHTSGGAQRETPNSNMGRSMSRYHRRPPTAHATSPIAPPLRSSITPQALPLSQTTLQPSTSARHRVVSTPNPSSLTANNVQSRTAKHRSEAVPPHPRDARPPPQQQHEDPRMLLQKERERQRLLKEKMEAEAHAAKEAKIAEMERLGKLRLEQEEAAHLEAERVAEAAAALRLQREEEKAERGRGKKLRKAEEQQMIEHKKEEERRAKLEKENRVRLAEKSRTFLSQSSGSPPTSPPRHEGFGLFKRRKDEGLSMSSDERPNSATRPPTAKHNSSTDQRPRTSRQPSGTKEPDAILTGGGGAVLGIDAPTSAVNGGERRVTVVFNKRRIQLPVTPTTTPLDLFKSADVILPDAIPVRTAVAIEWFKKVDIKRPLRNYEYVRDVMNSWDYDDQNELIITDSAIDGIDQEELLSYGVPEKRPEGMACMLNHSSKPGKWTKRFFLLRPDGQLVTAKSEKAKMSDQENVCHLTDYDIYQVPQSKIGRVKPPKKIVFAVKSLQKSNIFADESQYVHFFCTNDRAIANAFWKALQAWRSWHLKYEKGEGLKKSPATKKVLDSAGSGILPGAPSHNRGESVGSHYQLGAFTSLIDMSDFNKKLDEIEVHKPGEYPDDAPLSKLGVHSIHARKKSVRTKQPPPVSRGLAAFATNSVPEDSSRQNSITQSYKSQDEEAFAAGGLLGRAYTTRQKAAQDREQKQNGAFTEGPSLISNMEQMIPSSGLNRSSSTRSNHHRRTSSDIRRTASKRAPGMPQPLVDLTPTYRPPPQFAKQGKGYNPGANSGPLVESATSMEVEAIQIPSSTDWRAKPRPVYAPQPNERTKSLKGRGQPLAAHTFNNHNGVPQDDSEAFTGGLLSQAGYAQGNAKVGRGVMDGSKARGPMLDFSDEREFQSGSLLANIGGAKEPIIDRSGK
ncbi:uncharacterized protein M421DRAFT_420934 [Didymella exigua CBS 183.55]|uniref:PH domain-containing protein n=1 Tax=Didymella exigua CBS 183.55 TaxID=1150837 RepID=A0A6A5RJ36_9PLEO|nr:uncharacterized protein M421DRAFT_420934 [Didymella exigua CBS 183.55]KAF1928391.1 hypothetical protein M421DRAFT_420934 [Didymella exigua CBS 183.55]